MNITCRYTFWIPSDEGLLVSRGPGGDDLIVVSADRVRVEITIPAEKKDDARVVARDARGTETWELQHFAVVVDTDIEIDDADVASIKKVEPVLAQDVHPVALKHASQFLAMTRWVTGQFWLPDGVHMRHYSIQYFADGGRVPTSSTALEGRVPAAELALDGQAVKQIENSLVTGVEIPLRDILLLDARSYRRMRDARVSYILAAMSLENSITTLIRRKLSEAKVASDSRVDRFIRDVSNRLLSTLVLGLLNVGDDAFRDNCAEVFRLRNELVHAKRRRPPSPEELNRAIASAEQALELVSSKGPRDTFDDRDEASDPD